MHVADIAARLDPDKCRLAVARVMAVLGSKYEWNSDTAVEVHDSVSDAAAAAGLPAIGDQDEDAVEFWETLR